MTFESSFLERADYDGAARTLTVRFDDGSIYRYAEVPPEVFAGLQQAERPGTVFRETVRGRYRFSRLTPSKARPRLAKGRREYPQVACAPADAMIKHEVVSLALDAVSYDPATRCLVVYFDSKHVYRYGNVPAAVFERLRAAGPPDPGVYFNASVRDDYPTQPVR